MKELDFLNTVDEDYLVGLTNKGIVKRAAKDLEKQQPVLETEGEEITLRVEDVVCTIRSPLGESTCTCPQRTICKHIIMSVLYLKSRCPKEAKESTEPADDKKEPLPAQEKVQQEDSKPDEVSSEEERLAAETNETGANTSGRWEELKTFPIKTIRKTLGEKRFAAAIARQKAGCFPNIMESSIVTVSFEREGITVKLLEPVEYSTCSCHKKELCVHKAEALLCFQIWAGAADLSEFREDSGTEIDFEELHHLGKEFLDFLQERIAIGLARSSPSVTDSFERLAVIAHNADLPEFERQFRALSEEYGRYLKRVVSFSGEQLLARLTRAFTMAERLCQVSSSEELLEIAGEFKSSYQESADLNLMGFGCRTFASSSGFAGTVVYFLDTARKEWYTYTSARPTYYDGRSNGYAASGKELAPWGLECTLEELSEKEIRLRSPRVNKEHRLSASGKTAGTVLGKTSLEAARLSGCWFDDFEALFEYCYKNPEPRELERLVFVEAERSEPSAYDKFSQSYHLPLYDAKNRRLEVMVHYTPEDKAVIKELERLEKQIKKKRSSIPIFFGVVGTEEKRLTLYPLAVMERPTMLQGITKKFKKQA